MRNVYETQYFSRQITSISDMDVQIYELEYENENILVGVELSSNYICVDIPSVTEDINQYYNRTNGVMNKIYDKELESSYSKLKLTPVMFTTCNRSRLSDNCCKVLDEVTALRGLDEFEIRNERVVVNYLKAMGVN